MVVDSSILVAILYNEPEARRFATMLIDAERVSISAANLLEAAIVVDQQAGPAAGRQLDMLLDRADIIVVPVTEQHVRIARQAYLEYGKGNHRAGLNFGDCFAYALAKASGEPLLFKGNDFSHTDIEAA